MNEKEKEHACFLDPTTKSLFLIKEYENDDHSRLQSDWKEKNSNKIKCIVNVHIENRG
jgi:hypothetical protein